MKSQGSDGLPAVPSPEQFEQLYLLAGGYRVSQAIYVVAALGIADLLANGPSSSDTLARATLEAAGVAARCEVVGGDFFASVPAGGDAYILRQILHDWDDVRAVKILENCRRAMGQAGRVLVIEGMIAPDYRKALPVLQLDLEMLVNYGGRQRTQAEYAALFAAANFRLSAVVPLHDLGQFSIFEGVPA